MSTNTLYMNALTLAGWWGGIGATPLRWFSSDCSVAVCDRELKICMTDSPFKSDVIIFSVSDQVKSLTYDVINKPSHGQKMLQLCNAVNARHPNGLCCRGVLKPTPHNARQPCSGRWDFQKVASPRVLTFCISRIFNAGQLRSAQSRDHYKPIGK